jgi:hypothetical protein
LKIKYIQSRKILLRKKVGLFEIFNEMGASDLIEKGVAIPKTIVDINHKIISHTHHCAQFRKGISQTDDEL